MNLDFASCCNTSHFKCHIITFTTAWSILTNMLLKLHAVCGVHKSHYPNIKLHYNYSSTALECIVCTLSDIQGYIYSHDKHNLSPIPPLLSLRSIWQYPPHVCHKVSQVPGKIPQNNQPVLTRWHKMKHFLAVHVVQSFFFLFPGVAQVFAPYCV